MSQDTPASTSINESRGECKDTTGDGIPEDLIVDEQGYKYCIAYDIVTPVPLYVDEEARYIVRTYHEKGIKKITIGYSPNGNDICFECEQKKFCNYEGVIKQDYEGPFYLNFHIGISMPNPPYINFLPKYYLHTVVFVGCRDGSYCPQNSVVADFVNWMRKNGYKECLSNFYIEALRKNQGLAHNIIKRFLDTRASTGLAKENVVQFYDIVPTDSGSTYLSLEKGGGGPCQPSNRYPAFCSKTSPSPADYLFIQENFKKTFGVNFTFQYHRVEVSYADKLGAPKCETLESNGTKNNVCKFGYPDTEKILGDIPAHSLVHFAMQTYPGPDGSPYYVGDMTGGGDDSATISLEPFNTLGMVTYTHEWGHTWRLPHAFYDLDQKRISFQLEGIMNNSYGTDLDEKSVPIYIGGGSRYALSDPTDPMERYALEPDSGYTNFSDYVKNYNGAVIGVTTVPDLLTCKDVKIRVNSVKIQFDNDRKKQLAVSISAVSPIDFMSVGYIQTEIYNSDTNTLIGKPVMGYISNNTERILYYPLSDADKNIKVIVDPEGTINGKPIEMTTSKQ